jgi:hypothetical protein
MAKLGLLDPFAIGQRVPYLNCIEILKLGRSVDFLLVNGYHSSAQHVCRAMINAYFNIKAIIWPTSDFLSPISGTWTRSKQLRLQTFMEASADSRALLFLSEWPQIRRRRIEARIEELRRVGATDEMEDLQKKSAKLEDQEHAKESQVIAQYAARGILPAERIGNRGISWIGLTDYELAETLDELDIYDRYYRPFSDVAHVNVAALQQTGADLLKGTTSVGPRFDSDPWLVVWASGDMVAAALRLIDHHLMLKRSAEIDELLKPLLVALKSHIAVLGAKSRAELNGRLSG